MYRFLLTPRWLALSVLALLAVPVCVFMGSWQLSRFEVRVDEHKAARHDQNTSAARAPVPLPSLLPGPASPMPDGASGRLVTAAGRYDAARQLLVPDRTLDGLDGFYVLTPLRTGAGAALPVVRGWLPGDAAAAARAGTVPAAPAGQVEVTGALQYPETSQSGGVHAGVGLPPGQLGFISAASLVNVLPYPVYGNAWITAVHPSSPLSAVPPAAAPGTGLDLKAFQNLGYTGQWFVFAGFVVFMWFRLVRREGEARADAALGLLPEEEAGAEAGPGADPEPDVEAEADVKAGADAEAEAGAGAGAVNG